MSVGLLGGGISPRGLDPAAFLERPVKTTSKKQIRPTIKRKVAVTHSTEPKNPPDDNPPDDIDQRVTSLEEQVAEIVDVLDLHGIRRRLEEQGTEEEQ